MTDYRQLSPNIVKYRLVGTEFKRMLVSDRNLIKP